MSNKLYIPDLGERIRLTADWTFSLYCERRNSQLLREIGQQEYSNWGVEPDPGPFDYTVKKGTLLVIDRIYIRKGGDDYSSVTFVIIDDAKKRVSPFHNGGKRFWAKLEDVNNIEYEHKSEDQPWWYSVRDKLLSGNDVDVEYERGKFAKLLPIVNGVIPLDATFLVVRDGQKVFIACHYAKDEKFHMMGKHFVGITKLGSKTNTWTRVQQIVGYAR